MSFGEFDIIRKYFAPGAPRSDVLLGIGDDAAVLEVGGARKLVVAMDTVVEGVHFPAGTAAADIGHRALAVNLSDLAAMGAEPSWMTLSLALPHADEAWVADFAAGLMALARAHSVALVGGDTVRGPLAVTIQIGGWVEADAWLTRSGARPGDVLFVSGTPGDAAAGLDLLQRKLQAPVSTQDAAEQLRARFLRPQPRVQLGRALRAVASAAIDISDGLLTDLDKLCGASACGARLEVDALPISASLRVLCVPDACVQYALAGGDDYEIMFSVPPSRLAQVAALRDVTGDEPDGTLPNCTRIGEITSTRSVECTRAGQPFSAVRRGYEHFV
jgi:thiamine-monophosphate kinase